MGKIIKKKKSSKKQFEDSLEVKPREIDVDLLVPCGSTTMNLECSGRIEGAFKLGTIVNLIGDSHSGKCVSDGYILTKNGMELIDNI